MRARFFGPEASTAHVTERLRRALPDASARSSVDIRDARRRRAPLRRARAARSSSSSTPPPSPRTTGRRASRRPTSASTPTARSTCSRRRARHAPGRDLHLLLDEQGLRRHAEPPAARRARDAARAAARTTPTTSGIDTTMSIDRSTHSLFGVSKAAADLLVQEYGRYFDMPTVCFRGGCLTGPEPRRRAAARLPRLPDEVHGRPATPYTVFGYEGKQVRDNIHSADLVARLRRLPRARRARRPSTTSAAGARATARCSRRSTLCERIAGRELDWSSATSRGSATTAGGSATSTPFHARLPGLGARARRRGDPARDLRATLERWTVRGVKLSVVMPAQNEAAARSGRRSKASSRPWSARRSTTRSSSSTTRAATAPPKAGGGDQR